MASYEQSFGSDEPDSTHHLVTVQPTSLGRGFGTVKPPLPKDELENFFGTHRVDDGPTVEISDDSSLMMEGSVELGTLFSYNVPSVDNIAPLPKGFADIDTIDLPPEEAEQYLVAQRAEMNKVANGVGKMVLEIADSGR